MNHSVRRLALFVALLAVAALPAASPVSRDSADTKIRLMSEALHARDTGDVATARQKLEELLALSPGDETVQRLLAGLAETPARTVSVMGGTVSPAAPDAEADELLRAEQARRQQWQEAAARESAAPVPAQEDAPVEAPPISTLVAQGRSQYLAGEPAAAEQTFREVQQRDAANPDAGYFLHRIADERNRTRGQMLTEVDQAWRRPAVSSIGPGPVADEAAVSPVWARLNAIVMPEVNFSGMELSRVVNTLSVISAEFDRTGTEPKGVNIVLLDPAGTNPAVSITLRNLPLKRVLDFITGSVGYQYEVQADAVVVRPGGDQTALDTQFFPVSRSTVLRMTGRPAGQPGSEAAAVAVETEGQSIRNFLQLAGVSFEAVPGSTLAFDGSQLIVTQTPRNLTRIRNILTRYNNVRQVEIEAKFMEVQEGALEELGVQWNLATRATQLNATQAEYTTGAGITRSLADAFRNSTTSQQISISGEGQPEGGLNLPASAPTIPGGVLLGAGAAPLANITGIIGEFDVNAIVRALSQKSGTELLSAPKLTVLSGNPATITVAQELRYPQSYGQIQSQVGTGSISGGGSAGVSITSGTPQEFTTRNVGVELRVTPTVEEDDHSVSLDLNPKVTEFEGFVEYGGPSVAISGGTTVTVPPGFYQPIFAVREVSTRVTIWDGATLVMGGLTREDVKKVDDKVPVLGSMPIIGRLFRSQGESSQKRNLLIFVTANLVSPGGSLKKQTVSGAPSGSLYQNPTVVTPAGASPRR